MTRAPFFAFLLAALAAAGSETPQVKPLGARLALDELEPVLAEGGALARRPLDVSSDNARLSRSCCESEGGVRHREEQVSRGTS